MKKLFYYMGVAMLATGMMLSCGSDDDNNSTGGNNGGGNGGNGGGNNGGGNGGGAATSSLVFTWNGEVQNVNVRKAEIYNPQEGYYQILFSAVGDQYAGQNDQNLIELPSMYFELSNFSGAWAVGRNTQIASTEIMMDEAHTAMFTTFDQGQNVYTINEGGDYAYVDGSLNISGVNVDVDNLKVSATATANFKSLFDNSTVKTLKVVATNFTYSVWE